jgi:WD40 repeat protein
MPQQPMAKLHRDTDLAFRESAWSLGAPVTAVLAFEGQFAFTAGDGGITFSGADAGPERRHLQQTHHGAILSAAVTLDGKALLTGGDDGQVIISRADREPEVIATAGSRWIDHVATGRAGALAWSANRRVTVQQLRGERREFSLANSAGAIAFAPKSKRLAAAHYGGVTIWDLGQPEAKLRALQWKGSHLAVTWSSDERFLVTAMQEEALHGWRLSDGADMAMSGYPAKPLSLSWSRKSDWLATSGASEVILWPFAGYGPMGKEAQTFASYGSIVSAVAFHPLKSYVAAGFRDGALFLGRQQDLGAVLLRQPQNVPVAALAWSRDGQRLAYGAEDGAAGILSFTPVKEQGGERL